MKNNNTNLFNKFTSLEEIRREMLEELLSDRLNYDKQEMNRPTKILQGLEALNLFPSSNCYVEKIETETEKKLRLHSLGLGLKSRSLKEFVKVNQIPVKLLPNTIKFEKELSPLDWLFEIIGVKQRMKSKRLIIVPGRNYNANRFVISLYMQMKKAKELNNMNRYWHIGWKLMASKPYQLMALCHIFKGCERKMKYDQIIKLLREVNKLVEERNFQIDFKRVYIPKSENKFRPLGVPTKAWRIYLHMLNNLIVWSRLEYDINQHGYLPNRGVLTAWMEILKNIDAPFIYEVDLEKFFDNVDLNSLKQILVSELNYPPKMAEFFYKMNQSLINLNHGLNEDLVEERDRSIRFHPDGTPYAHFNPDSENPQDYKTNGVGQGAGTSCGLSTLILKSITNESSTVTKYADDFVIFSNKQPTKEFLEISNAEKGIIKNIEKSGWVKFDGKWLKPLKFLGLVWNPEEIQLLSSTRKGISQVLGSSEKLILLALTERDKKLNSRSNNPGTTKDWITELIRKTENINLSEMSKSRWFGKFVSFLFKGTWQNENGSKQLKIVPDSWVYKYWGSEHYAFLSSKEWLPIVEQLCEIGLEQISEVENEDLNSNKLRKKEKEIQKLTDAYEYLKDNKDLESLKQLFKWKPESKKELEETKIIEDKRATEAWKTIMKTFKLEINNSSTWFVDFMLHERRSEKLDILYPRIYYPLSKKKNSVVKMGKSIMSVK